MIEIKHKLTMYLHCDDCGNTHDSIYVHEGGRQEAEKQARAKGWAFSKDHKHCFCPKCAKYHRNTGAGGVDGKRWYMANYIHWFGS